MVDDYYKDGLAINRQRRKKQRSIDLGITATLHGFTDSHVTVQVTGPGR